MLARSSTVGLLAAVALSLRGDPTPYFTLESTGALQLAVSSDEARYGISPEPYNGRPVITFSMGATQADAALLLFTYADEPIRPGRYAVATDLPREPFVGRRFHPCFVAGSAERPKGFFHGEIGWVTITAVEPGRISGTYEMRARGFLEYAPADEDQWVTIRGSFSAQGDSTVAETAAVSAVTQ
jgi:hypothetical protein